jgi:UDPglucose 6-dehydrogenase
VPVGTEARIRALLGSVARFHIDVASNPEFLKEGAAVEDFLKPDRVIVGVRSDAALETLRRLYAPFLIRGDRMIAMDPASAELTKYACNAMLATRVSFMNELSRICEATGADIGLVRAGLGSDRRIGPDFLYASLGWGGSCFPKDVAELVRLGERLDRPAGLAAAAQRANVRQRQAFVERVAAELHPVEGRTLAVWGLAFKARTDDVRESAAIDVVAGLLARGARVRAHDPKALGNAREVLGDDVTYCADMWAALDGADALLVCTEWHDYRGVDPSRLASALRGRVVFDGRNLWEPARFAGTGLRYVSIGRPPFDER